MTTKARIAIRHLSGSKVNQIEQFDLDGLQEITIGREPSSRIAYDLQRDDEVSRKHAVIRIKNGAELYFRIADLNSSNGTFLNGERIAGEVELLPEDIVELGSSGPKFIFDVQPRPANLPARTRQMAATDAAAATRIVAGSGKVGATAEQAVAETRQRMGALDTKSGAKVPVGKATILRLLSDERRKASHIWIGLTAAIAVLAIVGGGVFYMHSRSVAKELEQQLAAATANANSIRSETDSRLAKEMGITPKDIKRLGDSTVFVVNSWQLYDRETNRPLYQKMVRIEHKLLPAYVRMSNNEIVRWLTLEQTKDDVYQAIGDRHSGSGFVVNKDGFILTNAHVAAAWSWRFNDYRGNNWTNGVVYNIDRPRRYEIHALNQLEDLSDWIPGNGGYVFEASRLRLISSGRRDFFGRNDILTVRFPGTRTDFNATLIRTSPDSDLAEIKVEAGTSLSTLELADDGTVEAGEKVILLGYPNVSQESYGLEETNSGGMNRVRRFYIPEPTVTQGIVSKLPATKKKESEGALKIKDTLGEMYQLDIFAGPGSSGGPVLNSSGKVIGLLSMGRTDAEHVSFAVPVSGVRELLQAQRAPH